MPKVRNATRSLVAPNEQRTASAKRDAAFLAQRRATEAANLKKTLELRALRLANQDAVKALAKKT